MELTGLVPLIQVYDMPTSLRFYRDLLGFGLVQSSEPPDDCNWAWLRRGGAELMLNTSHADTGLFIACADVDGAYAELLALGLEVKPPVVRPFGMKQLFATDPDGYLLCFQQPA